MRAAAPHGGATCSVTLHQRRDFAAVTAAASGRGALIRAGALPARLFSTRLSARLLHARAAAEQAGRELTVAPPPAHQPPPALAESDSSDDEAHVRHAKGHAPLSLDYHFAAGGVAPLATAGGLREPPCPRGVIR